MTSLLLISTDKTTVGFTQHGCISLIVTRCGGKKWLKSKSGKEVDEVGKQRLDVCRVRCANGSSLFSLSFIVSLTFHHNCHLF